MGDPVNAPRSPLAVTVSPHPSPPLDSDHDVPQGLPAEPSPEQVEYARRVYQTWLTVMGEHAHPGDGSGDVEDFWEQAARLDAAMLSGASRVLLLRGGSAGGDAVFREVSADHPLSAPAEAPMAQVRAGLTESPTGFADQYVHWGPLAIVSPLWHDVDVRADQYARTATFARHAGRRTALVGIDTDPPGSDAAATIAAWTSEGIKEVVIKTVQAKHGIWRLRADTDIAINRATLQEHLGWSLVHLEGRPQACLLQEAVTMEFEYRVFVVDGEPVTGAGCIEEHTPLFAAHDRTGEQPPFSPLLRQDRRVNLTMTEHERDLADVVDPVAHLDRSPVIDDPHIVRRLVAFAREVAADALREGAFPRAYVVDVAIDPEQDRPLVVEFNGLTNAGLYASRPDLVAQAIMRPGPARRPQENIA